MPTAALLRAADARRLSSATQEAFRQAEQSGGVLEWMDLVEPLVERPVLAAYGVRDVDSGLARMRYEPNSRAELRPLAHWLRYNRAAPVPFAVGAPAPLDGVVVHGDAGATPLASVLPTGRPTLVVASSRT